MLDIRVLGDPSALRGTATWLGGASDRVHGSGSAAHGARTGSEHGWQGASGDGFRDVLTRFAGRIDELSTDLGGTRDALSVHADDLDTVRARMAQAREIAAAAGLSTSEAEIAEPGPAPVAPAGLPVDRVATVAEVQAFDAGNQAVAVHSAQVVAYEEASRVVAESRGIETQSQSVLNRYLNNMAGRKPFVIADVATNLPGVSIARTSRFRERAQGYADRAAQRASMAGGGGPVNWVRNTLAKHYNLHREVTMLERATPTAWSRGLDRLPQPAKNLLDLRLSGLIPVLRRIPVLSLPITAWGISSDIENGRDPVHATASGVSSLVAGAVVGGAIGGPIGLVAGAVVGAGVGFVVDEWGDDAARGAGEFGKGVWDAGENVVDGIGGGVSRIREALDGR